MCAPVTEQMETSMMIEDTRVQDSQSVSPAIPETLEQSGDGARVATGGIASTMNVVLRQGQSHDDPSQLRANGRYARMCLSIDFGDTDVTQNVARILSGNREMMDQEAWASLRCVLHYSGGEEADLKPRGRHPDVLQVMDPNGTASSVASFRHGDFSMVSRARLPKRRRVDGEEREEKKLDIRRYLSVTEVQTNRLETEVKIATNVTSRQHDSKIFFWKFFFSADLNDGNGEINAECRSIDFEYVASKKVQQAKPKERKPAPPRRPKHNDDFIEDDEEEHLRSVPPHVPYTHAPRLREKSTRQCAEATRRTLHAIAADGGLDDEPAGDWAGEPVLGKRRGRYDALPVKCQQTINGTVNEDEKFMLGKKKGGLNLCRVESLERICDHMYTTPTQETDQHNLLCASDPAVASGSLRDSEEAAMNALGLDLLRESPELLGSAAGLGLERCDSKEALLNDTMLLDRCVSSQRLLKVPSKEIIGAGTTLAHPQVQLTKSVSQMSLGSVDFTLDCMDVDTTAVATDDTATPDGSTEVLQSA